MANSLGRRARRRGAELSMREFDGTVHVFFDSYTFRHYELNVKSRTYY